MQVSPLENQIDTSIAVWKKVGLPANRFLKARKQISTRWAVAQFVESGDRASGFLWLQRNGMLDASLEAIVSTFPNEFPAVVRRDALFRMEAAHELDDVE